MRPMIIAAIIIYLVSGSFHLVNGGIFLAALNGLGILGMVGLNHYERRAERSRQSKV